MRIAAAHVFQSVLQQLHREAETPRQITAKHCVLDTALDAVTAANVNVVMDPDRGHGNLESNADLVVEARHLDRSVDVEHVAPRIPACRHAEGLYRHGGRPAPFHPQLELA